MHVAFDRGDQDLTLGGSHRPCRRRMGGFFGLDIGHEVRNRLLHHPRALHHLGQKHFAGAKKVAHVVHPVHERALDHIDRAYGLPTGLFGIGQNPLRDAMDQRVG